MIESNEHIIQQNAKLADLCFDNKPEYFVYIKNRFNIEDDDKVMMLHHKLWRPDSNWNQIHYILEYISDLEFVSKIEIDYIKKRIIIDASKFGFIMKEQDENNRTYFIENVWDCLIEFYDLYYK